MQHIRNALHMAGKRYADAAQKLEGLRTLEWIKGNLEGLHGWAPEAVEAFHDLRDARTQHRQTVNDLVWNLEQNAEYY